MDFQRRGRAGQAWRFCTVVLSSGNALLIIDLSFLSDTVTLRHADQASPALLADCSLDRLHGIAAYRYIRPLRMMEARKGLLYRVNGRDRHADRDRLRFCGARSVFGPRETFGESPSTTLRRACVTRDY